MNDFLSYSLFRHREALDVLHVLVLFLSFLLIGVISYDTFFNRLFLTQPSFLALQFWVCIVFLIVFIVDWVEATDKWRYACRQWIFLIVSIPYLTLLDWLQWTIPAEIGYLLRLMPLIRGGYALAIVVGWFAHNKIKSLLTTYLILLFAIIYFASLLFFVSETKVNVLVSDYGDALWWAFMNATTVGCNIEAVTFVGKVLSVLLASVGLLMFPIFTVYITDRVQQQKQQPTTSSNV